MFSDQNITSIVNQIVASVQPEEIFLFGSAATKSTKPDSDIDLLVIESDEFGPQRSRRKELRRIFDSLRKFAVPIDVLLYSKQEINSYKNSPSRVVSQAIKTGQRVYERH